MKEEVEKKSQGARVAVVKAVKETPNPVKPAEKVTPTPSKADTPRPPAQSAAAPVVPKVSADLEELVSRAEAALAGKPYPGDTKSAGAVPPPAPAPLDPDVYATPLPLGFEPPPGFKRPSPPKKVEEKQEEITPVVLPLVTPAVSSLAESEPIISHLAGTIDNLASYLSTNPSAASKATDVLESAKKDLTDLANRFEKVREDERLALETKLDEQTREYSVKLLELEMEAQDKLDNQQEDFKTFFEDERAKIIQAYRNKLENELRTQTELINERYATSFLSFYMVSLNLQAKRGGHRPGY